VQTEVQKLQNTLSQQVAAQVAGAAGLNYDQQAVIGAADQQAQQLMSLDDGGRKSALHDLQVTDYVMYSVVVQRMEELQSQNVRDAAGGAAPAPAPM
jgi:hypothetical protein